MKHESFYLLGYDIANNKRRRRLIRFLEDYGYRIQYSVFIVNCNYEKIKKLKKLIERVIEAEEDSIVIFPLTEQNWNCKCVMGKKIGGLDLCDNEKVMIL